MVSIDEVRILATMDTLFYGEDKEEQLKEHISKVKEEIYGELEKLEGEHYFWKWCKDNWELFDTYDVMCGCLATEPGKSVIYGPNLRSDKLILTITDDKCAALFLRTDRAFQLCCDIHKK